MAAPSHPYTPPHHRNMKTECSYHKEDDPLLRSSIHALKDAMEVASLLLPLLSMCVETMESTPDDPRRRGKAAALWDRVRSRITALMSPMSPLPPPNPRCSDVRVIAVAMLAATTVQTAALFALRINVCEQQQKYFLRKASITWTQPNNHLITSYACV
ncbi:hypothetical protein U9M48_012921 [Paspalum notatum var. saurae]|uniref:Uncharacterized protein n=1 Tax=Paspalum notatum var. saurae TaxID=547442 RepID=A0AAQ3T1A7_PASNO